MVFAAYSALSPASGLIATVACRVSSASLIPASVDQDYTLLPTAGLHPSSDDELASIASRPTSVTTRTPLDQGGMDADNHIFLKNGS
jgi:hypothetical protein